MRRVEVSLKKKQTKKLTSQFIQFLIKMQIFFILCNKMIFDISKVAYDLSDSNKVVDKCMLFLCNLIYSLLLFSGSINQEP